MARVEQARGVLITTRSAIFPQGSYQGDASRGRDFFGFTGNRTFNAFAGTFNMAWEIDLWGRIRRATEAARANLLATNEARRGVVLTLVTEVAASYLQLRELDVELEIARNATQTFGDTLNLFQRQFEGGIGTKLAVARGEAALAQAAATIPDTERRIVATENAISILLGWVPTAIPRGEALTAQQTFRRAPRPACPPISSSAVPTCCRPSRRCARPTRRSAWRSPISFRSSGSPRCTAARAPSSRAIVKGPGNVWQIAASVAGPLLQGGRLIGNYKAAKANWEASKSTYEQTVLISLREVSDALVDADKLQDVRDEDAKAVSALSEASDLATIRYTGGLATYFEVLEAQQQLFPAELVLAQVERDQLLAVVQLYRRPRRRLERRGPAGAAQRLPGLALSRYRLPNAVIAAMKRYACSQMWGTSFSDT